MKRDAQQRALHMMSSLATTLRSDEAAVCMHSSSFVYKIKSIYYKSCAKRSQDDLFDDTFLLWFVFANSIIYIFSLYVSVEPTWNLLLGVSCPPHPPWSQMEAEQLLSLSGPALAQAVSSLLETPGLYVFSDILELPNVKEVHAKTPTSLAPMPCTPVCLSLSVTTSLSPSHCSSM